jgi:hypothetical protein
VRDRSAAYLNVLALNTNSGTALVINRAECNYDIKLPFCPSLSVLQRSLAHTETSISFGGPVQSVYFGDGLYFLKIERLVVLAIN